MVGESLQTSVFWFARKKTSFHLAIDPDFLGLGAVGEKGLT